MRALASLTLVCLLLIPEASAQSVPYGVGAPGTGDIVPLHTANGPWVGNPAFNFQLDLAYGNSIAWLLVSTGDGSYPFGSGSILVSLTAPNPLLMLPIALSGLFPPEGQGSGALTVPLPNDPILVGLRIFSQYVVDESGVGGSKGYVTSNGVMHEFTMSPQLFVGCSAGGSSDAWHLIDPLTYSIVNSGGGSESDNNRGAVYSHGGQRLHITSSMSGIVSSADVSSLPAAFSPTYAITGGSPGSGPYGVDFDPMNNLLWTLANDQVGTRELIALDGNVHSPSFGSLVGSTIGLNSGIMEKWVLSPSGKKIAALQVFPNYLIIVDSDPTSPSFLASTMISPVPSSGAAFSLVNDAVFTADESMVLMIIQNAGAPTEVARYDLRNGSWIDHNSVLPGIQHMGMNGIPAVNIPGSGTSIDISSNGSFAVLSGIGDCGWVGRLDLDLVDPDNYSYATWEVNSGYCNAWAVEISPDDSMVAVAIWEQGNCAISPPGPEVRILHSSIGTLLGTVSLPLNGGSAEWQNLYTLEFR